jgi:hypothetical protein
MKNAFMHAPELIVVQRLGPSAFETIEAVNGSAEQVKLPRHWIRAGAALLAAPAS